MNAPGFRGKPFAANGRSNGELNALRLDDEPFAADGRSNGELNVLRLDDEPSAATAAPTVTERARLDDEPFAAYAVATGRSARARRMKITESTANTAPREIATVHPRIAATLDSSSALTKPMRLAPVFNRP